MSKTDELLRDLLDQIDIPPSAYEKAQKRYEDLGEWFSREDSTCARYSPHIYPQGSFRLGTVIRPLTDDGEYDLDVGCRLRSGIAKHTHTQHQLKALVGRELADYRTARGIKRPLEEKHRCWSLSYADELSFHLDIVPSIPESAVRRVLLESAIALGGVDLSLARDVASMTGAITDDRSPSYRSISEDWRISNSEGYARWFESRIKMAGSVMNLRALVEKAAKIDDLPAHRWKSPLQRAIQVLKRHRDAMFEKSPASKPISIIITTVAARAYRGESTVEEALTAILANMPGEVSKSRPRVPNPVNPEEDFADKWYAPSYSHLKLEESFWSWLDRARNDFKTLVGGADPVVKLNEAFRVGVKAGAARGVVGLIQPAATPTSKDLTFPNKPLVPSKPAGFAG